MVEDAVLLPGYTNRFMATPCKNPRDNVELEQRLIHVRGQCGGLLPSKLPRPLPTTCDQALPLLGIVQPLERLHVITGIATFDDHRRAARDFLEPARARRD